VKVPFGDTVFTVTVAARGSLAGSLPQRLPWIIGIVGTLLTLGATALTVSLIERRRATERLADQLEVAAEENRRLYAEQRGIAQTLQHALLPASLPQLPGLQISARYEAGAEGVEIGGDWYDVIELADGRLLLIVGDVSGRGLTAATAMAALRFAIHAYAAEGDDPATFLPKLSRLISVHEDQHLATVLCAVIDARARQVTITNAGHLPPLMIGEQTSTFVDTPVGLPVGIDAGASYSSTTIAAPPGGTLLAFTDGLVERRGESIEVGLERLRSEVSANHVPLDQLLSRVLHDLRQDAPDDTAVAGIRWLS
jgi:serine phosphatase RsbU (regulator of sigma subunit)